MKKTILWLAVGLMVAVIGPTIAVAGGEAGACVAILAETEPDSSPLGDPQGGEVAYVCGDALSFDECDLFCGIETNAPVGEGLFLVGCEWLVDTSCEELTDKIGESWEGACEFDDQLPPPLGGSCFLISEELPNWTSQEICETGKGGGEWQGDGSICGAPVPAMPKPGQAALMVVLLLGALVILNVSGTFRAG